MSASKIINLARVSLFVLFAAATATATYAHHSFGAEFDSNKPIKLQGVVTRLEWTNPHVYLWVDSKDAKTGKVTQWGFEMGPPHMLQKAGWKKNSLTLGEMVEIDGWMARDGSNAHPLVSDGAARFPVLTRDNQSLVFAGRRAGQTGLWRSAADGSNPQLIATVADAADVAVSPDNRTVYFTSLLNGTGTTYRVPITGGTPVEAIPRMISPAVSPDGQLLAGVWTPTEQGAVTLAVLTTDGRPVDVFRDFAAPSNGSSIVFTNDGKHLLFTSVERMNIWNHALGSSTAAKITNFSDMWVNRFALSPDGKWIAMSRGSAVRDAFLIRNLP